MKALTAAEMREVDRLTTERYGIPSAALMENAGTSVAEFLWQRFANAGQRRIVVLCGKGNNGGDGFVAARKLQEHGAKPVVYSFAAAEEMHGDAAANRNRWKQMAGELYIVGDESDLASAKAAIGKADIIVDALLGTGVRGAIEGPLREAIEAVNGRRREQAAVAVDIPSGATSDMGRDTGDAQGVVIEADYTVTFTAPKIGMLFGKVNDCCGQLVVREIGSPRELVEEIAKGESGKGEFGKRNLRWSEPSEFAEFALPRKPGAHKGDYGHALIVAGAVGKTGAAVLASWAALRAGAGLVTVATPEPALPIIAAHTPEVMTEPLRATERGTISLQNLDFNSLLKGKKTLGIGPGLSTHPETSEFVRRVVASRVVPIVLDADGLNAFAGRAAELKNPNSRLALTPHPGEMSRLLDVATAEVQSHRIDLARKAATDWNCYVILKGHQTVIAEPNGTTWVNSTGNPGMGTGGTGDVLTGILTGLTAQYGAEDWGNVLSFGVYLHGLAGDLAYAESGEAPLMASDLIQFLPRAYQHFYSAMDRGRG